MDKIKTATDSSKVALFV